MRVLLLSMVNLHLDLLVSRCLIAIGCLAIDLEIEIDRYWPLDLSASGHAIGRIIGLPIVVVLSMSTLVHC